MRHRTKKNTPVLTAVPIDAHQAFVELTAEIAAVRDEDLLHINLDIERAASIALATATHLKAIASAFNTLPGFDDQVPKRLRSYALAALYAHLVAVEAARDDHRFTPLLEEATKLRDQLLSSAELLVKFGLFSAERVAQIRAGTGHLDTASDLIALCALFSENWNRVGGKTPITREQVVRAGVVGTEFHEIVASRKHIGPHDTKLDEPQRTRARAFTLLVEKYSQCRRAVEFLRWDHEDADEFAPSIYIKGRRRPGPGTTDDEPPQTVTPGTVPVAGLAPASTTGAAVG